MNRAEPFKNPDSRSVQKNDVDPESRITGIASYLEQTETAVKELFILSKGSHDWDHTLRVCRLCRHIGAREHADMDVLSFAAYLHDIGRRHEDEAKGTICHAEKGAEMAGPMIADLPLSEKQKANIIHCILSHRFRGKHQAATLEARVLFDADKIDAIGAIGVARAFLFAGEIGARLHNSETRIDQTTPYSTEDTGYREYVVKLSKIKDRIMTAEGKRIAFRRHAFMEVFFNRFLEEQKGKR